MTLAHLALGGLMLLGLLGLHGCGEQDLYRPPESPYEITGRVAVPGEAMDVAVMGNYAYVAMEEGGLQAVDISNPSNPRLSLRSWSNQRMKSVVAAQAYDADGTPRKLAFVSIGTEGLGTFDITSPDSLIEQPQEWNGYYTESVHFVPAQVITEQFMLFIADGRRGVAVLFQDLDRPGGTRFIDGTNHRSYTEGHAIAVAYADGYAYIADDQMGVSVVDASDLDPGGSLQFVSNLDTPGEAVDIVTEGGYVFVADSEAGIHVMRIGTDHELELVASLALSGNCQSIALRDGILFVAAKDAGLYVIDVRDPEHPAVAGNISTPYAVGVDIGDDDIVCIADRDDGLIVFRNPELPSDFTPPAAVTDLAARLSDVTALELTWTAPGDDGVEGSAELYELRWSLEPIADSTWESAADIARRPTPTAAGTRQSLSLENLASAETYYFALKARDDAWNWSGISNSAAATMTIPALSGGMVAPDSGDVATPFTYSVIYSDPEGEPPTVQSVTIDNLAYEMAVADSAPDYLAGATFEYTTTLGLGSHQYQFAFDDGHGPLVTTLTASGPKLPPDPFEFEMRLIDLSGGTTFAMGSPDAELGRDSDETQHDVTLTRDYYISEIEVTQTLYEAITGENPSWFEALEQPVTDVSWYDAIQFCNALSANYGYSPAYVISDETYNEEGELIAANVDWDLQADGFRLATEAEWEFACRAGSETSLTNGDLGIEECEFDSLLDAAGWYCGNSDLGAGPRTHDVGLKEPNAFGLYDMHGNVWEWCWDGYAEYATGSVTDPSGPASSIGDPRVRRGGHWEGEARECRSASREWFYPNSADHTTGFRITRNAE